MDASTLYCEKHRVFQLLEGLLGSLIIHKPEDPISFLIDELRAETRHRIVLTCADSEVAAAQAQRLAGSYGVVVVEANKLVELANASAISEEIRGLLERGEPVPDELVLQAVSERLVSEDCQQRGWVLTGFPRTIEQAQFLLASGNIPTVHVSVDVADEVVIDRISGRRVDPEDPKTIFHTTLNPPSDPAVAARLVQRPEDTADHVAADLTEYHKHQAAIQPLFAKLAFRVEGGTAEDGDVIFQRIAALLDAPAPSHGPRPTPAIALVGPTEGVTEPHAARLAATHGVIHVSPQQLLHAAAAGASEVGEKVKELMASGQNGTAPRSNFAFPI